MKTIKLERDFMFAAVFSGEDTMPIAHLLSDYLGEDYEYLKDNIKLISRKLDYKKKRTARLEVDLLVKHKETGDYENIEINTTFDTLRINRNLAFLANIYATNYPHRAYDPKVHKPFVRQINFSKKVPASINNKLINEAFMTIKGTDKILTEKFEYDIVDMEKIDNPSYNYANEREEKVARWCKILKSSSSDEIEKELKKIMSKQDANTIVDKVKELSEDSEMISLNDEYDKVELEKAGERNLGREEGIEQGIEQNKVETAKKMLDKEFNIKTISEITGLSEEEISNLKS